jgi:CRISPR-associated protein Cmr2
MGDGDEVGDKLKQLAERNPDNTAKRDQDLTRFTELMRTWGRDFKGKQDLFAGGKGRVIYAGGDDFLGVLYSEESETENPPEKVKPIEVWNWLSKLPEEWKKLQADLKQELELDFTYSVGFVWAGHQVPQRDVLQHCREAEKRAKSLGRDRVTIRIVFNSGRYVQWTCPWDKLSILEQYVDRDGNTGKKANWSHVYNDWQQLKSRHAIRLIETEKQKVDGKDRVLAIKILDLYFDNAGTQITNDLRDRPWKYAAGDDKAVAVVNWIDDLINVGWNLCSNT